MVPEGEPVRLAQPTKATVWVRGADGAWVKGSNSVTIPEGWYALAMPEDSTAKAANPVSSGGK